MKNMIVSIIRAITVPLIMLLALIAIRLFYSINIEPSVSGQVNRGVMAVFITVFAISITMLVQRIASGIINWYAEYVTTKTATTLDEELLPFLRRTINIIIWTFAILITLPLYGVNINALIATLGVGSLAIALAAKDPISNIIAGFLIMIDRPFRIGDSVKIPSGEVVKVLDIGIRRSKFLSEEKAVIIVPNLDLSKSKIINYTYGEEIKK